MGIVEDRVVLAVGMLDLIERLGNQERLETIASHERQRAFEEVQPPKCWKLVEHDQHALAPGIGGQFFGQPATNLVEQQPDQRLGAADVRGRDYEVERCRSLGIDQIGNAPVALPGHLRHDRIAVETQKRHGGREHARPFVLGLVEQFACGAGNDRMDTIVAKVRRHHHRGKRGFKRPLGIGQESNDASQRLVGLGIKHMEDCANQ
jgi:hypothetical protein